MKDHQHTSLRDIRSKTKIFKFIQSRWYRLTWCVGRSLFLSQELPDAQLINAVFENRLKTYQVNTSLKIMLSMESMWCQQVTLHMPRNSRSHILHDGLCEGGLTIVGFRLFCVWGLAAHWPMGFARSTKTDKAQPRGMAHHFSLFLDVAFQWYVSMWPVDMPHGVMERLFSCVVHKVTQKIVGLLVLPLPPRTHEPTWQRMIIQLLYWSVGNNFNK